MSLKRFNGFFIVKHANKEYYFLTLNRAITFIAKKRKAAPL